MHISIIRQLYLFSMQENATITTKNYPILFFIYFSADMSAHSLQLVWNPFAKAINFHFEEYQMVSVDGSRLFKTIVDLLRESTLGKRKMLTLFFMKNNNMENLFICHSTMSKIAT